MLVSCNQYGTKNEREKRERERPKAETWTPCTRGSSVILCSLSCLASIIPGQFFARFPSMPPSWNWRTGGRGPCCRWQRCPGNRRRSGVHLMDCRSRTQTRRRRPNEPDEAATVGENASVPRSPDSVIHFDIRGRETPAATKGET